MSKMKFLIVNADDMGADEGRNDGILKAVLSGSVTSISLLANGPAFKHALTGLKKIGRRKISFGVHVNLSEGKPLSKGLKLLTGSKGLFLGKASAQSLLLQRSIELEEEIAKEVEAQISFLKDNIEISHIDGHQHLHVFPSALKPVAEVCLKQGISFVRTPYEPFWVEKSLNIDKNIIAEARFFSSQAKDADVFFKKRGLRSADNFRGLFFKGRLSLPVIKTMAELLPEGTTELMVHPGLFYDDDQRSEFSGFSTPEREIELKALLSPDFKTILAKNRINLCSFLTVS